MSIDLPQRYGVTQNVAYTATSAAITNPFGVQTRRVRLVADSACFVRIGDGAQIATTSDVFLPANWVDYAVVTPGQQLAVIRAPTDGLVTATSGTLNVTEMA
jgi:hypothetical protein